jgi:uncharacterized protein (DUF3820 family)
MTLSPQEIGMDPALLRQLVERKMPFGRYAGVLLKDLPVPYVDWFARKGFPPGEIGRLLALLHEIQLNGLVPLLWKL